MDPDAPLNTAGANTIELLSRRFDALSRGLGRYIRRWEEIVGPAIAAHTMPTSLREDALRVRCESAIWTSELMHLQHDIVARLQSVIGEGAPRKIIPYTGRIPARNAGDLPVEHAPLPDVSPVHIAAIHRLASTISDDDVRARMIRAMIASTARTQASQSTPQ